MSLFGDIFQAVSNPIRSAGEILASPFVAFGSIIEGKNVGDTIQGAVKQDFGRFASGNLIASAAGTETGRAQLQSETASALSLGLSRDYVGETDAYRKLASGGELDRGNYNTIGRSQTKQLAFGLAGGYAASSGLTAGQAAQYAPAVALVGQGKYGQALAAGTGTAGLLPTPFQDILDRAVTPKKSNPQSGPPKVTQKGYSSSLPGGDFGSDLNGGTLPLSVIAVGLVGLYFGVRYLRKH